MSKFGRSTDNDYKLVANAILEILDDLEDNPGPAVTPDSITIVPPSSRPDPRFPDNQNGLGPPPIPGQIVPTTTLFPTGNICGDPNCGRTRICAADYNRRVKPMGYPGV